MTGRATLEPRDVIRLEGDAVVLLDQTLLPGVREDRRCTSADALIEAIRALAIRGAPALGVAGAMGVALAALVGPEEPGALRAHVLREAERLAAARPTAVNLRWAAERAAAIAAGDGWADAAGLRAALVALGERILDDEDARCRAMGRHGAALFADGARLCTQCNTGALACGGFGTALGVARTLHETGRGVHVWVPETRPLLQGARLTAWECDELGIPHAVLTDNAVATLFRDGLVDGVVVGADRIAANGDAANKIGTYALAVLARHHGVPFYVVAPTSTIDPAAATGAAIPIEERARDEVAAFGGRATTPAGSPVRNPAFDVTPAALISGIVTEQGVATAPYDLARLRPA